MKVNGNPPMMVLLARAVIQSIGGFFVERDFEQFFKANERRIHFQIQRLGIFGSWYDEFFSEGVIALWQAYRDFDERKGADVGMFINNRISFRLVYLFR